MYYDIFFQNPQAMIVSEPGESELKLINERGPGTLINFPGPKRAVVYAVSERRHVPGNYQPGEMPEQLTGFLHCLVTEEQLAHIEADNVPFDFFAGADSRFKRDGKPAHVFNPEGVCSQLNGYNVITKLDGTSENCDPEYDP